LVTGVTQRAVQRLSGRPTIVAMATAFDGLQEPASPQASEADLRRQRVRVQRHLMGVVTTVLTVAIVAGLAASGGLPATAAWRFGALAVAGAVAFAGLFLSGLNRRFPDPSLTVPQILWAGVSVMVLAHGAGPGHPLVLPFYLMALLFGAFRLRTRQLLAVGMVFAIGDGAAMLLAPGGAQGVAWAEGALLMLWFAWMGGYVSQLRTRLQSANAELKQALQKIEVIAANDELTSLSNRRTIREVLERERKRSERSGKPLCVAIVDADHFKRVNDRFGHAVGDEVLRGIAEAMRGGLRDSDSVGRYGGEEFLVVLPLTDAEQAVVPLERIRTMIERRRFPGLPEGEAVSVSVGFAQWQPGEDPDETVQRADAAVYAAKHAGRNRVMREALPAG
jgi:diguanylate cyclase (GGDEF)-like protein